MFPMLEEFRRLGRKVFLLTNSLWEYTQVVMNYLEGGSAKSTPPSRDLKWQDYFDLIIVGGNKPAFLLDERSLPLFKVDPVSGRLINLECLPGNSEEAVDFLNKNGKLFQGGNAQILHKLLNVTSGDSLIYVGDHMYSDILRSKRTLGWRTCLIVPELQGEIKMYKKQRKARMELLQLRKTQFMVEEIMDSMKAEVIDYKLKKDKLYRLHRERNTLISDSSLPSLTNSKDIDFGIQDLTNELQRLDEKLRREISVLKRSVSLRLRETAASAADNTGGVPRDAQTAVDVGTEREDLQVTADQGMRKNAAALAELEEDLMALGRLIRTKLNSYDKSFHSRWGQLFKAGFQESRFAKQVKDYSCVYTGKVSNLGMASPTRPFRPVRDKMPHDHFLEGF